MRRAIRPILLILTLAALLGGCVIPRSRNVANGAGITTERPRLDRILPRITTEQEWKRHLGKFQTGVCDARFCWVRWTETTNNFEMAPDHGTSRAWRIVNVFAEFGGDRLAARPQVCSERELLDCLNHFTARVPPPPLAEAPLGCRASEWEKPNLRTALFEGSILFGKDGAALRGSVRTLLHRRAPLTADMGWDRIDRLHVNYGSTVETLYVTVHFRPPVEGVSFIGILLPPRDLWRLAGAVAANNPHHR